MNKIAHIIEIGLLLTILYLLTQKVFNTVSKKSHSKLVLDTSALIDGRVIEVAKTGFIPHQLIVPKFIISELQLLADGRDAHKRERARFGLDMVQVLQEQKMNVQIYPHDPDSALATDDKLVAVAKKLSADLCTTDYNLNKVATIDGVKVLNLNELANAVRPVALPGEQKRVKIVQKGSNKRQGVGYLDDGSMVVVEEAAQSIGKIIDVEVSRYIQTDAGKMLFGKRVQNRSAVPAKKTR